MIVLLEWCVDKWKIVKKFTIWSDAERYKEKYCPHGLIQVLQQYDIGKSVLKTPEITFVYQ